MADRPILFSGPMVRALLAGTKTQTRRVIDGPEQSQLHRIYRSESGSLYAQFLPDGDLQTTGLATTRLKYALNDRVYVREHWRTTTAFEDLSPSQMNQRVRIRYEADGEIDQRGQSFDHFHPGRFRQGMHMPRWASRLTLTVTDVRVERLQDISEEDATAEGVKPWPLGDWFDAGFGLVEANRVFSKALYCGLWDHINGKGAWASNPWVAAYTFTVERGNIDQLASKSNG